MWRVEAFLRSVIHTVVAESHLSDPKSNKCNIRLSKRGNKSRDWNQTAQWRLQWKSIQLGRGFIDWRSRVQRGMSRRDTQRLSQWAPELTGQFGKWYVALEIKKSLFSLKIMKTFNKLQSVNQSNNRELRYFFRLSVLFNSKRKCTINEICIML